MQGMQIHSILHGKNGLAIWCNWQLSIPRTIHPAIDEIGRNCNQNQDNPNVWFLTGTFGNSVVIRRSCTVPKERAILFPIIYKEDSFAEDKDLCNEFELMSRARDFAEHVIHLRTTIDGEDLHDLYNNRIQSEFFDLTFPTQCVYDVEPGLDYGIYVSDDVESRFARRAVVQHRYGNLGIQP